MLVGAVDMESVRKRVFEEKFSGSLNAAQIYLNDVFLRSRSLASIELESHSGGWRLLSVRGGRGCSLNGLWAFFAGFTWSPREEALIGAIVKCRSLKHLRIESPLSLPGPRYGRPPSVT